MKLLSSLIETLDKQALFKLQQDVIDIGHGYDMELLGDDRFQIKRDGLSTISTHKFGNDVEFVIGKGGGAGPNALTAEKLVVEFAEKTFYHAFEKPQVVNGVKISVHYVVVGDIFVQLEKEETKRFLGVKRTNLIVRKGFIMTRGELGFKLFFKSLDGAHSFMPLSIVETPQQWAEKMVAQFEHQLK